jgi:hypothetical protein
MKGQLRENRRGTQERTIQRKPWGHTRKDNPEKTVGAHKKGQSRENRRGTQERTTQRKPTVFSGLSAFVCSYGFLWIVRTFVPLRFCVGCPFLCAPTVFSGLSFLVCPYGSLWVVLSCVPPRFSLGCPYFCAPTVLSRLSLLVCPKKGQLRENRRGTQERTTQRKPQGQKKADNSDKTVGAHKGGQSRENRLVTQERTTHTKP